jgi:hypothetical protein
MDYQQRVNTYPLRYSNAFQLYRSSAPYPMNFMQAPSYDHQILVNYGGQSELQGLSTVRGPFMFPVRTEIVYPQAGAIQPNPIQYPRTHSVPDAFQQQYIREVGGRLAPIPGAVLYRGYYPRRGTN